LCSLHLHAWASVPSPHRVFWEGQGKWYRKAGEILGYDLAAARKAWLNEASNPQERKERGKSDYLESEDGMGRVVDFPSLRHGFITYLVTANVPPDTRPSA
jgi:hypothetical protein